MRKLSPLIVLLVTLAQPAAALALAGGPTLTAVSSAATVAVNDQVTVTVQMDTKTYQVSAAEIHITYPSDKLQALSVAAGSFLPSTLTAGTFGSGAAAITVGSGVTPKQGSGPVMIITFKALAAGSAQVAFATTTQVAAAGQTSNAVDAMTPVTITVTGAGTATTTPTPTLTPTPVGYTYTPMPYATPTPTGIAGVSQVQTGPGETTILGLILASIITLLYVGYTGSDAFRRNEAKSYSKESRKSQPNFKE